MIPTTAFTISASFCATSASSFTPSKSKSPTSINNTTAPTTRRSKCVRMEATSTSTTTSAEQLTTEETPTVTTWPPAEMTEDWVEAVERLVKAVPNSSRPSADAALEQADGDETVALRLLMDSNWSDVRRQREVAVKNARANGDVNRVSAVKEAELRRKATGSAQDFFKAYVETEGSYVDEGYVDEDADAVGKMMKGFKNFFGGKK